MKRSTKKKQKIRRPIPELTPEMLEQMTPVQRQRLLRDHERQVNRRDTQFSTKFRERDLDAWRAAAERDGLNITDWIEKQLNVAAVES